MYVMLRGSCYMLRIPRAVLEVGSKQSSGLWIHEDGAVLDAGRHQGCVLPLRYRLFLPLSRGPCLV